MRSWSSWFVLVGALVAGSAGAQGSREFELATAPTSSQLPHDVTQFESRPESVAKSTWFEVDEQPGHGWYSPALRDEPLPRWIKHNSLPRDTIENVAIRYGVSPAWLRRWNGMSPRARLDPSHPKPLRVRAKRLPPPRERLIHVAVEGDTWDSVARRYGVFDWHLQAWNKDEIGRGLEPGERVTVWVEPMVRETMRVEPPAPGRAALIPPGANGIGTPQSGRLAAGVQVPPGEGYKRRYPNQTWGTTYAVRHLVLTLDDFHQTSDYEGTLMLGSMSFRRGGKFGPHVSHQSGRDVDIRLPEAGRKNDWDATWDLILAFARSGAVQVIFLDYRVQRRLVRHARRAGISEALLAELFQFPEGPHANHGMVRHSPGHDGHIHVRYACGPFEPNCGD